MIKDVRHQEENPNQVWKKFKPFTNKNSYNRF